MKNLSMLKQNVEKIKNGIKTTTLRTYNLQDGWYLISDSVSIYIHNRGLLSYSECPNIEKTEAFDKEPIFQSTKDFLQNKRKLYVYDIISVSIRINDINWAIR